MAGRNGGHHMHALRGCGAAGLRGCGACVVSRAASRAWRALERLSLSGMAGPAGRQMGRQMGWRDGWRDCKYMVLAVVRTTGPLWQLRWRAGSGRVLWRALRALGKLPWLRRVMCGACRALACAGHGGPCMCEAWRAWLVRGLAGLACAGYGGPWHVGGMAGLHVRAAVGPRTFGDGACERVCSSRMIISGMAGPDDRRAGGGGAGERVCVHRA